MLTNREVILCKVESTYNTDPTPTPAANAMLVEEPSWSNEGLRMVERPAIRSSLGTLKPLYAGSLRSVSFSAEVKGPGAAYSATVRPEIADALRGCGLAETIVTTVGVETATYLPASTGHESVTIYYYQDGKRYILTGCRGNVSFTFEAGGRGMANFTFTGHSAAPTDTALASPTYDTTIPPIVLGNAFTVNSYAAVINALSYDLGNAISTPGDMSATDGYGEIIITKRNVTGSIDPQDVLLATHNFISEFTGGTAMALTSGLITVAQYNRYTVTSPAITYTDASPGDRDGLRTFELPFMAAESGTDDEISIAFS